MDVRIGRWLSEDPLHSLYVWNSPYNSMSNNPINRIDPTGMGDYYSKDGKKLGSDGKTVKNGDDEDVSDDKAYVTTQDIINEYTENGVTDWDKVMANSSTTELSISNSTLGKMARTVAEESSGNKQESYALASAIVNLSKHKDKSILSTLSSEGIYGYNGSTLYTNSEYSLEASINALIGGHDYSNGAIRWDGYDLAARGFNHIKARTVGMEISSEHFKAFKDAWPDATIKAFSGGSFSGFSSNFDSGIHLATQGDLKGKALYESTAVHGRTMFWGKNQEAVVEKEIQYYLYDRSAGRSLRSIIKRIDYNEGFKQWKKI